MSQLSRNCFLLRCPVLVLLVMGVPIFLANYFAGRPGISGWDANYYFAYAAAVAEHGSLDLDPIFAAMVEGGADATFFDPAQRKAAGLSVNYPLGHSLIHVPATLLGRVVAGLTEGQARATGPTGQLFFCLSCIAAAAVGAALIHRAVRRLMGEEASAIALYTLAACSMLGYYWFVLPALSHTTTILAIGLATTVLMRLVDDPSERARWWGGLGLVLGWAVTVRLQDIGTGFLGLCALVALYRSPLAAAQKLSRTATYLAGGVAGVLPQLLYWKWHLGTWTPGSYSDYTHFDFARSYHLEVLFSPRHGLFLWHPILLVAVASFIGWLWRGRTAPQPGLMLGIALLLAFLSILGIGGFFSIWWFGDSFGSRPFLSVLPLFWIGLAWLWTHVRPRPRALALTLVVVVILAGWNALLALAFHLAWMSRSGPIGEGWWW